MNQQLVLICKHYWVYEPPNGEYSKAVCKLCGAKTNGKNAMPEYRVPVMVNENTQPLGEYDGSK